jgi:hypothetical protein
MPAALPLPPGRPPRRARYLVPLGTPHRAEILAAVAIVAAAAAALFAPLTLLLSVIFYAVSRISRWRPVWLAVPACCGALWLLAVGPGAAVAGFGAAPRAATGLLSRLVTDPAGLARLPAVEVDGLPAQFPVALIVAAAAAALAWWVRWLHTDEWDLPMIRPGLVSRCRRGLTAASVKSGGVVTRNGACLGVDRVTGSQAALSWREAGAGVLVTGAARPAVQASGWQIAHAAIRRRKPVIVVDLTGSPELPGLLTAVCAATAAPLQMFGAGGPVRYEPGPGVAGKELAVLRSSPLGRWLGPGAGGRISLAEVVRGRTVALFSLDRRGQGRAAEMIANVVAADIAAVYAALGRKGVPAEGLAWYTECDGADPGALAQLTAPGSQPGLGAVLATTAPRTAAELAGQVGIGVFHRLADRDLAARLAALTGTRIMPTSRLPAHQGVPGEHDIPAGPAVPPGTTAVPVVSADALCELADDEFVLVTGLIAVRAGTQPAVTVLPWCQAIPGRIPAGSPAPGRSRLPARTHLPARRDPLAGAPPVPGRPA